MPLFVAIAMVLMSSVLICCTKDVVSLKFLYSVCNRLYSVCIRLYSFVLRLYPVCTPFVPRLCRSGCHLPRVVVLRLYSFVFACAPFVLVCTARDVVSLKFLYSVCTRLYPPRFANIILLGDGRNTKVQKRANVLRALYWAPVGQTGSLWHAPLPRRPVMPIAALGRLYDPNSGVNGKHVFPILLFWEATSWAIKL